MVDTGNEGAVLREKLGRRLAGLPRSLRELDASLRLLASLRRMGWHRSLGALARSADGACLPWFTYPAIEWLTPRLRPEMQVFEWGAGASTLFFAARCSRVVSVESDPVWLAKLGSMAPGNVTLVPILRPGLGETDSDAGYVQTLEQQGEAFDIVVIDGLCRKACLEQAIERRTATCAILFDNVQRAKYQVNELQLPADLVRLDFYGYGPASALVQCTSVFCGRNSRWLTDPVPLRDPGI